MEENTVNTSQPAEAAGKATFDQVLQDPDYRRAFDERVRTAVSRRFRTVDAQRAQIRQLAGEMAQRLGLAPGEDGQVDLDALREALAEDPSSAPSGGDSEEQQSLPPLGEGGAQRRMRASAEPTDEEAPAAATGNEVSADDDEAPIRASFRRLLAEGERLRQLYPGLDLGAELANPRFAALLASLERTGAPEPLRMAYEATHHDQILGGVVR